VRVTIVTVGRPRHRALADAIGDYESRAARYWSLAVKEVREERGSDPQLVRRKEGERLAEAIGDAQYVACAQGGRAFDSAAFASWLGESRDAARDATFVIGGAFGLEESVSAGASSVLSLAPWTLPHEVARLVLAEQLYRAGTILRGEPYHK
jgi:23S rRNA (pseudouridine1915-N3)-methyltransferase